MLSENMNDLVDFGDHVHAMFMDLQQSVIGFQPWLAAQTPPAFLNTSRLKRKRQFMAGRFCAEQALGQAGYDQVGLLARLPHGAVDWPSGWQGSISHSGTYIIAIVAKAQHYQKLAVDIQQRISQTQAQRIESQIISITEMNVASMYFMDCALRVALIFSAKESLFKLLNQAGEVQPFFAAELIDIQPKHMVLSLTRPWRNAAKGQQFLIHYVSTSDYVLTWAVMINECLA